MQIGTGNGEVLEAPKVTIVVLNWNDIKNTRECLESIMKVDYTNYETLVVDNASTDGSQDVIRVDFPEVKLVENPLNLGFAGGFNVGIMMALRDGARYVLCLNNDTVLDKMFLKRLMEAGLKRPDAGALCPMEYDYFQRNRIRYAGGSIGWIRSCNRGFGQVDQGQYEGAEETMMLCGAAVVLRSDAARITGGFDADYFFDWEDRDLAVRLRRNGFTLLFVPGAKLWHKGMQSARGVMTPLRVYFSLRNGMLFARKNYCTLKTAVFLLVFPVQYSLYAVARSRNLKSTITSIAMAIAWHLDRRRLPDDPAMVEILREL